MDFTSAGITYAFLLIPTFFAIVVVLQGIEKMSKRDATGPVVTGFGVFFLLLIAGAYFFFIK